MLTPKQEQYVLRHLSLIDMERAQKSLAKMQETEDPYIKEALFRDAVVSYVKPFSDNRGENQRKGLRINQKGIPSKLKNAHKRLEDIRNKLFAHNDLEYQAAQFGPGTSFTVKGYESFYSDDLVKPLEELVLAMHQHLQQEMQKLRENGL
jgi:hypothetical protein